MAYASGSSLLSAPFKRSNDVDLIKPLRAYITNCFGKEQADAQKDSLDELQNLRNKVLNKLSDKHESAIQILCRYHDQLVALETKIPLTENGARINFKWTDAFGRESFFSGKASIKMATGAYERVCILYSLSALYSACAATQNLNDDKGLQTAVKYFRQSAGLFSFLQMNAGPILQQEATSDLNPDVLNGLAALMIAQAQDCVYMKVSMDKKSDGVVAKVAAYAADLYADALKVLQINSIKDVWPKDWLPFVAGKQAGFHALSEYHQAKACGEEKKFGEEIGRLKLSIDLFNKSSQASGSQFQFRDCLSRAQRTLQSAEKDNNLIYFDKVPKDLPAVGRAQIAKEIQPTFPLLGTEKLNDLFARLVPMAVHQALAAFDSRRSEMINMERARLREATDMLNTVMASLNLPASLEDTGSSSALPSSIIEKNQKVRSDGGIDHLSSMMSNLPDLMRRNKEILAEAIRQLDDEQTSDDRLREQFGERWARTPSNKLTESLRAEATKFDQILTNAESADGTVRQRFDEHKNGMQLLSKTEGELRAALPEGGSIDGGNQKAKEELKELCSQVEVLKNDRTSLETQINEANCDDIPSLFSKALTEDGAIDEESLSTGHLNSIFSPIREAVSASITEQESLLCRVQQKNNEWLGSASGGGNKRVAVLSELASAYDNFVQLKGNLEEGSKFYNDLTEILLRYQTKVQDFCFARKTEKEELMKDLQSSIVGQRKETAPAAPQYQATTEGTGRAPPPRPPPPKPQDPPSAPANQPQNTPTAPGYGKPKSSTGTPPVAPTPAEPQYAAAPSQATQPYGNPSTVPGYAPPSHNPYGMSPAAAQAPQAHHPPPVMPYPTAPYGMPQPYPQAPYGGFPNYGGYAAPPQGYYMTPPSAPYQYPQQQPYPYPSYPQAPNQQWPPRQ